jgi:hypothetical protein
LACNLEPTGSRGRGGGGGGGGGGGFVTCVRACVRACHGQSRARPRLYAFYVAFVANEGGIREEERGGKESEEKKMANLRV